MDVTYMEGVINKVIDMIHSYERLLDTWDEADKDHEESDVEEDLGRMR